MIHDTAIISDLAIIGSDVSVGAYSVIGGEVEIRDGTIIDNHVVINGSTIIGRNNHIYSYSAIGGDPQDKKYNDEPTSLIIGDNNTIREYCTINRGTIQDKGKTIIGNNNWIMAYVHIAHDCVVGNNTVFANNATLAGHVLVGDWAIFAGFTGAHQFSRIGAHSFIGMNTLTTKDIPAYVMAEGQPIKPRGVNVEGLKRRNFTSDQIRNIKEAYKILYRKDLKLNESTSKIAKLTKSNPELEVLLDSIMNTSDRGIIR
ncbi:MAG: acyl-ACP--UDP-N-acetylglucosamine O-acyltransferase [Pseudomonadota bacterium]|nr:acyl-ACP--UDP-N-acetylglucosamine O-acyltransferase [Pseudomonadota bacterium]